MGVWGFSVLFNSPQRMCFTAASIGAITDTLRLTIVDFGVPPEAAAFIGALERVVADPVAAARIGRAGLARGEECFDPRRAVETYRKLIAGLAALPAPPG